MKRVFDRSKSLQELEKDDWGEAILETDLIQRCHALRRKPLSEFTVEDLRVKIGQKLSLPFLIPLAIERLEAEPLAEGDFHPGDLLRAVLRIDETNWQQEPEFAERVRRIISRVPAELDSVDEFDREAVKEMLQTAPLILEPADRTER